MSPEDFLPQRPRLLGLAYRMLGSVAAAEDVVQETWVRWAAADGIEAPAAWATTVCTRLCLDARKSAAARYEAHVGPWLPEPWVEAAPPPPGPLRESLSMAFLLLLEELSGKERAAFLLHDVFDEGYDRVAEVLGVTEAHARQLVRRARAALDADRPRFEADPAVLAGLLAAFGAACAEGDMAALERLLAVDAVAVGDGGGRVPAARRTVVGADRVARFIGGLWRKAAGRLEATPAWVNGGAGFLLRAEGRLYAVTALEVRDGRIVAWRNVLDPHKLQHLSGTANGHSDPGGAPPADG